LFATHNILTPESSPAGYHLLKCIRSYLDLDMYASLEVHTEETISAGRDELLNFGALLNVSY
jgi:hypothetical protein